MRSPSAGFHQRTGQFYSPERHSVSFSDSMAHFINTGLCCQRSLAEGRLCNDRCKTSYRFGKHLKFLPPKVNGDGPACQTKSTAIAQYQSRCPIKPEHFFHTAFLLFVAPHLYLWRPCFTKPRVLPGRTRSSSRYQPQLTHLQCRPS